MADFSLGGLATVGGAILGSVLGKTQRVQFIQNSAGVVLDVDVAVHETHSRKSTPTKFPIESGKNISDHIILEPFSLELQGIISDTPIGGLGGLLTEVGTTAAAALLPPVGVIAGAGAFALFSALSKSKSPSVAAFEQLISLQEKGEPFDVITTLKRYTGMWITSISVPRDDKTGQALVFSVTLQQLLIVSPQTVSIQIFANPGLSANNADKGDQHADQFNDFKQGQYDANPPKTTGVPHQ